MAKNNILSSTVKSLQKHHGIKNKTHLYTMVNKEFKASFREKKGYFKPGIIYFSDIGNRYKASQN
jgi:hypothetical protein